MHFLSVSTDIYTYSFSLQLDYKVDDKMLKDVFKIAGKVMGVEISKDQDGKSRGFGVVGELLPHNTLLCHFDD